jgi:hypothetical protein
LSLLWVSTFPSAEIGATCVSSADSCEGTKLFKSSRRAWLSGVDSVKITGAAGRESTVESTVEETVREFGSVVDSASAAAARASISASASAFASGV